MAGPLFRHWHRPGASCRWRRFASFPTSVRPPFGGCSKWTRHRDAGTGLPRSARRPGHSAPGGAGAHRWSAGRPSTDSQSRFGQSSLSASRGDRQWQDRIYLAAAAETAIGGQTGACARSGISLTPQTVERFAGRFPGRVRCFTADSRTVSATTNGAESAKAGSMLSSDRAAQSLPP